MRWNLLLFWFFLFWKYFETRLLFSKDFLNIYYYMFYFSFKASLAIKRVQMMRCDLQRSARKTFLIIFALLMMIEVYCTSQCSQTNTPFSIHHLGIRYNKVTENIKINKQEWLQGSVSHYFSLINPYCLRNWNGLCCCT